MKEPAKPLPIEDTMESGCNAQPFIVVSVTIKIQDREIALWEARIVS